jgi:hypothetical protein
MKKGEGVVSLKNDGLGEAITKMIAGLKKALPKHTKSLKVGTEMVSVSEVLKLLAWFLAYWTSASDKAKTFHTAISERNEQAPDARKLLKALKPTLVYIHGPTNTVLLEYGITPESERRQLTTAEQVVANERRKATREARGTKGRRQKAAIRGSVPRVKVDGNGQNVRSGA